MMKEFLSRKRTQFFSVLMVAVLMIASFVPSAFALNYNGTGSGTGNKSLDFNGYEYTKTGGTATLNLYFNKSLASSQVTGDSFRLSCTTLLIRRLLSLTPIYRWAVMQAV